VFLLWLLHTSVVRIGSYDYEIAYGNTLGKTEYPIDDSKGLPRSITLPDIEGQKEISWQHESIHACFHDHEHHFKTKAAMDEHLNLQTYTEEEVATILTPCLLAIKKVELSHIQH